MRGKWIVTVSLCALVLSGMVFAEEAKTTELTGTVTGPDDKPLEGAAVRFYSIGMDMVTHSYDVQLLGEAKSDAEGKFAYSAKADHSKGHMTFSCLATKGKLSAGWATSYNPQQAVFDIHLTEPKKIIGFVQDSDGTGIAEAEVRLLFLSIPGNPPNFMVGVEPIDDFLTKSSSDGRFEFDNLPADATAVFLVKKAGKGTLHTFDTNMNLETGLTYQAGQTDIILTMQDACKIFGTVVAKESQKPIAGVSVVALDSAYPINLFTKPAVSAKDGTFEIVDILPGSYQVQAYSDEWIAEPVNLEMQGDAGTKIELIRGGTLEVKVIDSETKEAIPGVSVNARDEQTQQYQSFHTDENGLGSKQVLPGTYKVSAYKQGYRSSNEAVSAVVEDGKTAVVTVELGGQPKIKGLVTDLDGKSVEGAAVRLFPDHGPSRGGEIKSDEKGQFTLSWDPGQMGWTEGEFNLLATHSDKKLAGVIQIAEGDKEATIKLEKGITAKGKVINSDGDPIAGARVSLQFHGSRFSSSCGMETNTGPKGQYEFTPLAVDQRYSVHISNVKGYGIGQKEIESSSDAAEVAIDDIVLLVADQKVTGQVVDIDGKGLADVQLHCYGESQPNISAKTDKDGKFALDPVCAGEISISANYRNGQDYQSGHVRTEGGAEDVKIIVTSRGGGRRFVPRKPASLVGKDLPDVSAHGVELPEDANSVLVFVWDMNQRPSRHFVKKLNTKADLLKEKGVTVLLINAAPVEKAKLDAWLKENGIAWPCGVIAENAKDVTFKMGVQGLPWLILTDAEHKVAAEGFSVEELEKKLDSE